MEVSLMKYATRSILICFVGLMFFISTAMAADTEGKQQTTAIVLATFGTTYPSGLPGILHIRERMQKRFPGTEIRIAFTSNMIRKVWQKRLSDEAFIKKNPTVPKDIYRVKGPLATIADLQDEGYSTILVQPGHITLGEEYLDLVSFINGLNSISTIKEKNKPFLRLAISRPALGSYGPKHPFSDDINEVAKALAGDVQKAKASGSALLYMGHGNEFFPSSASYLQLMEVMKTLYPDTKVYLATVEGFPGLDPVMQQMKSDKVTKVLLKPLMDVAGDHANNDMAGSGPDSMKSKLTENGFQVTPVIQGMGEEDAFADVFVDHLAQTAIDYGITLK
jgi:sirohydrochlorin cobaltochelatase